MGAFNEYALLVAVMLPVGLVAGLNLMLWCMGERGTLLLPTTDRGQWLLRAAPAPLADVRRVGPDLAAIATDSASLAQPVRAANQDMEREAA